MKIIKAFGPKDLRIVDRATPTPREDELLVAVKACGVCGSDKWCWEVTEPSDYIAGHEVAGEVTAIGSEVTGFKIGDHVILNNVKGCGTCAACLEGNYVGCQDSIIHMSQGFAEYVTVPERNCLLLDSALSFEEGCLIFDNWGTPYGAIERGNVKKGDYVIINGCGPIGIAAAKLAKLRGAVVIAIDPVPFRTDFALAMGADQVFSPFDPALRETLKALTHGTGVDLFIECSGKAAAYDLAFEVVRKGGKVLTLGEGVKLSLDVSHVLIEKQLSLIGSFYSSMDQGKAVQQLLLGGKIKPLELVTHYFTFEELPDVFGDIVGNSEGLLKTILVPKKTKN